MIIYEVESAHNLTSMDTNVSLYKLIKYGNTFTSLSYMEELKVRNTTNLAQIIQWPSHANFFN